MADVEIKNPAAIKTAKVEVAEKKPIPEPLPREIPYPSKEAEEIAKKFSKGVRNEELEKIIFAIDREKQQGMNFLKIKGNIKDATEHALFAMGFRMKHGYEDKPKYLLQGQPNVEPLDLNKEYCIVNFPA